MKECLDSAITTFKDTLDKSKVEEIHKNIELMFNDKIAQKDIEAIRKEGLAALTKQREERIMKKYLIATNFYELKKLEKQADNIFTKQSESVKPHKAAIDAVVSFLFSDAKHGGASVESIRNSIINRYSIVDHEFRKITSALHKNFTALVEDGRFDDQLLKALWEFGEGREAVLKEPELAQVAKVFHKANVMMSFDKASINPLYRYRKNYGASLHFDRDLTASMPFPEWAAFIKTHVDMEGFKSQIASWGIDPAKVKKFESLYPEIDPSKSTDLVMDFLLKDTYDRITAQKSVFEVTPEKGAIASAKNPDLIMRAIAEGRVFRYKNADSFAAVFKRFNDGTVYDSIMQSINANARNMALDQALGKIPLANLQLLKEKTLSKITDVEERKLAESYFDTNLNDLVNIATGTVKIHRNRIATTVQNIKAVGTSLLGGAPVTAFITDPVWGAVNFAGLSGENIFSTYGKVMGQIFSKLNPKERIEVAKLTGELLDDIKAVTLHQVTGSTIERKKVGALTKVADFGFMMSGMKLQNIHAKTVMAELFAHGLGRELQGKAGKNSRYVRWLKQYNMDDVDVAILKQAVDENGRLYQENVRQVLPSKVLEILQKSDKIPFAGVTSKELVESIQLKDLREGNQIDAAKAQIKTIPWTEARVKNYLNHLAVKLNSASFDMARMSSPTPTGFTNFVMGGKSASTDTVGAAVLQLILQFKAFGAGALRNHRFLSNSENVHAPKTRIAQLGVMLTIAGGVSLMLKDVLEGKTPRDPTAFDEENPIMSNFMTQAVIKSGFIPFIADYALTDYAASGSDITKDIIGPSGRMASNFFDASTEALKAPFTGEFKAKKIISPLINWAPGINTWYAKGLINHMFLDDIRASVDPKHTRKRLKSLRKNSGMLWNQKQITPMDNF